jgi:hypothetical protein
VTTIIEKTGAKVVISSSWRIILSLSEIRSLLESRRFIGEVISQTPSVRTPNRIRGDEIQAWLDGNPNVEKFVILDDDADMGKFAPYLVQTDARKGITDTNVDQAIGILGG